MSFKHQELTQGTAFEENHPPRNPVRQLKKEFFSNYHAFRGPIGCLVVCFTKNKANRGNTGNFCLWGYHICSLTQTGKTLHFSSHGNVAGA